MAKFFLRVTTTLMQRQNNNNNNKKPLVSLSQSTSCLTRPSSPALHLLQPHPAQLMDVFAAATPRPQPEEGKIHFSAVFSFFLCVCHFSVPKTQTYLMLQVVQLLFSSLQLVLYEGSSGHSCNPHFHVALFMQQM